jgi:hypothetical protein
VPASELGSHRGGPRCLACPVARDPAASPDVDEPAGQALFAPDLAAGEAAVTQPHRRPQHPVAHLARVR